jgi:peptide deformylase
MILKIVAYGNSVLRKKCEDITPEYPELAKLILDMRETMRYANGIGLAAPQINKAIRLFLVDINNMVFINAKITATEGKCSFAEGCLSIPGIGETVMRPEKITINYFDENFIEHTKTFEGLEARVIQHEYDHIEGKLFTDHLAPIKKKLIKGRLKDILDGKVKTKSPIR